MGLSAALSPCARRWGKCRFLLRVASFSLPDFQFAALGGRKSNLLLYRYSNAARRVGCTLPYSNCGTVLYQDRTERLPNTASRQEHATNTVIIITAVPRHVPQGFLSANPEEEGA